MNDECGVDINNLHQWLTHTHLEGLERSDEGDIVDLHILKKRKDEGGLKLTYKGDVGEKQSKLLSYCFWSAKALTLKWHVVALIKSLNLKKHWFTSDHRFSLLFITLIPSIGF
jgi:hypothetical protein